ncbi:DHRS1 [Mytilus coruscus]|uniref:DHRS1 n=1 Tax=Mytilus coruscus TaxID=42192 RepID=A0A6J8EEI7_MYTCO|nr:DHRS1 [Mytilus coruscus]
MAADCAFELRASNVAFVSLWPVAVRTEIFTHMVITHTADGFFNVGRSETEPKLDCSVIYSIALSTEYEGKANVALATDLHIMKKSGKLLMTTDLGYEYGFKDIDGNCYNIKPNIEQTNKMERHMSGKVCIVTGATRGIGKGIALQLGQAGATVNITGATRGIDKGIAFQLRQAGATVYIAGATRGIDKGIALQLGQAGATVYITGATRDIDKGIALQLGQAGATVYITRATRGIDKGIALQLGQAGATVYIMETWAVLPQLKKMSKPMSGKVCLVTGATRGIGKGIALQLGQAGATVYITGRTLTAPKGDPVGGSLTDTANEIENRGGKCIPVQCDHSKDSDIEELFNRVSKEQNGHLDLLVNNAYAAVKAISDNYGKPFWEQPITLWDTVNIVGLRNHYLCSVHAVKLMTTRKTGLIVNVSSAGGLRYIFNVPYGVGKEANDRMAADCAVELRKMNVAFVSLWPGAVRTENLKELLKTGGFGTDKPASGNMPKVDVAKAFANGETPEYAGKAIVALATDPNIMKKSGKILITADLGYEYGFKDIDGKDPSNIRQVNELLKMNPKTKWIANFVPNFVYIPKWMLALAGNKL